MFFESDVLNHSHLFFPIFFSHHLALKTMKPIALYKHNRYLSHEHESNDRFCAKTNRRDTFHCEEPGEVLIQTLRFEREARFELPLSFSLYLKLSSRQNHVSNSCKSLLFVKKLIFSLYSRTINSGINQEIRWKSTNRRTVVCVPLKFPFCSTVTFTFALS